MMEERASASGAISDLRKLGAIEGFHFRVSPPDEDITRYPVAFDRGPLIELVSLGEGSQFRAVPGFKGFAILNADGMELVGCPGTAALMRTGGVPGEVAYLATADELCYPDTGLRYRPRRTSRKEGEVPQDTGTTLPWRQMIPVDRLIPGPDNPRRDPGDLSELTASIRAAGQKQELIVTPARDKGDDKNVYYYIEDGWRRWLAMKEWATEIRCTVIPPDSGRNQSVRAIITSLVTTANRLDLAPVEKARAFARLADEFGLNQGQIAAQTGFSSSTVSNSMKLLELSLDTQERLKRGPHDKRHGTISVVDALRLVGRQRAANRRKNGGTGRAGAVWEPDWFTSRHPLATKASTLCNRRDHNSRRRIGAGGGFSGACGQCWESEIRRDEQLVIESGQEASSRDG